LPLIITMFLPYHLKHGFPTFYSKRSHSLSWIGSLAVCGIPNCLIIAKIV